MNIIDVVADHWLSSLRNLEARVQAIIQQIGRMIEMWYTPVVAKNLIRAVFPVGQAAR